MSTPDKTSEEASGIPSPGGFGAYKISRTKMVLTGTGAASKEAEDSVHERSPAHARAAMSKARRPVWIAAGSVVVAVAVGLGAWGIARVSDRTAADSSPLGDTRTNVPAQASGLPSYRALVIGINQYAPLGGTGWAALHSARADAESVAKTLADDYGFHVQTLLDGEASRSAILNALDELATTGDDGADLIYFAGHGYFDDKLQEGYWIPADARKSVDGRQAKEDWLWNSTITRLIGASRARHVLVMSDACYGGSLFRGDEPLGARSGKAWYERAISKPSRYLITSGGLEPVLDSGAGHSVFAQQVINYLSHGDQAIFSANDLGLALRERVASLTGQMVQMGPLPVSGHAGGEFVFVRRHNGVQMASLSPEVGEVGGTVKRGGEGAEADPKVRQSALQDAVALTQAGAPKVASSLVSALLQQNAQDAMARSVAEYIARNTRQEGRDELRKLIDQVAAKGKAAAGDKARDPLAAAPPRVVACLGPALASGLNPASESVALLYRIALRSELEMRAGLKVIEREALESILQEQNLGVSDLADPRARLAIGKLLPASLLLLGDLIPTQQGEKVYMRLVDTETTQVLASFSATRKGDEDQDQVCAKLAQQIVMRIARAKPLQAPVSGLKGSLLQAGLGSYHGIRAGQTFGVIARTPRDQNTPEDCVEKEVGSATVRTVSDYSCELEAVWKEPADPRQSKTLWIRETPPAEGQS